LPVCEDAKNKWFVTNNCEYFILVKIFSTKIKIC